MTWTKMDKIMSEEKLMNVNVAKILQKKDQPLNVMEVVIICVLVV